MCSTRAAMELMAYQSQKKQVEKLNAKRAADTLYKHVLEVGDIGSIYVQPKTRNSCDHPYLPVMVTSTCIATHSSNITYKLCTQYGHLRGSFTRETIKYEEHMTAEMLQINPTKPNFDALTLTIEEASAKHNVLGGKLYCRCQKDCILVPKCSCIALGKLCRDKCHGSFKKLTHIRCSNCVTTEHATLNVSPKLRKRE